MKSKWRYILISFLSIYLLAACGHTSKTASDTSRLPSGAVSTDSFIFRSAIALSEDTCDEQGFPIQNNYEIFRSIEYTGESNWATLYHAPGIFHLTIVSEDGTIYPSPDIPSILCNTEMRPVEPYAKTVKIWKRLVDLPAGIYEAHISCNFEYTEGGEDQENKLFSGTIILPFIVE